MSKRFGGIAALSRAEFRAEAGEVHALLGENGAGKSTFIQILCGALHPDEGNILFRGQPFRAANPSAAAAAGIAAVFQDLSLIPDLTVEQNIWFRREALSLLGTVRARAVRERTLELFARHRLPAMRPNEEVWRLTLAERQVVEIAKALARDPTVLILDEATSALAPRETEWLLGLARSLAADGRLVIYISHRLAEVRQVADRITVFRNGMTVAARDIAAVSDDDIIADMLGRRMDRLYPERRPTATRRSALKVRGLTAGDRLREVDLDLREGEILGVGGLQGHGQRELFEALFGIGKAKGSVVLWEKPRTARGPRHALTGRDGIALVPEDRRGQGLLLTKSVRENLTLAVMPRFSWFGILNARKERALVNEMMAFLRIKAKTPEQLAGTLSGGNQQKVIFGKMLLTEARVLLLYDPTRGVDVGTKGEIFQLMRDVAARGYAILFYSSDLPELVHVADRVAVMRNGQVAAVLEGDVITEDAILRAAMFERARPPLTTIGAKPVGETGVVQHRRRRGEWRVSVVGRAPFLVACAMLMALVVIYGCLRDGVFTLEELNIDTAAAMTLILAATGQTIVLLRGGVDLSIGGMISLGTVVAATRFGDTWATAAGWSVAIVAIGLAVGVTNGLVISALRLQSFLVTLATWSVLSGAALLVLPIDGGSLPSGWMWFGSASFLGLSSSVWILIVLLLFWLWFRSTRFGITIRATGSDEKSAYLSGVSLTFVSIATYGLSGLFAALAALYLTTQTGAGSPTIGKDYILPSVAAAVIGGISLFGGRGGLSGMIIGAFILTIIGNLVFVLSVSSYWQPIVSGVILLAAVLASSLGEKSARRRRA